jgi:type IV pilus assembly protein PilW
MPVATTPNHRQQLGLTMIELMIAITIALVLLAALGAMYGSSVKARNDLERSNRQIENGRYSIQLLREDLGLAGFFGELNLIDVGAPPLPAALPDICVTHLSALPTPVAPAPAVVSADVVNGDGPNPDILDYLAVSMQVHVQGFDNVADADLPACLTGLVREGTDVIAIRRASTCAAGEAGCSAFGASRPYLQASQCDDEINNGNPASPEVYFLRADADTAAFDLRRRACDVSAAYVDGGGLAPIRRLVTHIYFIANDNVAGDGIPTLKRLELISTGWTTTALVEGIEDMQFEYGVDGDDLNDDGAVDGVPPDGVPDEYADDPINATLLFFDGSSADAVKAWRSVMTTRVHLLSRGTGNPRPGFSDGETYRLANSTSTPATRTADENRYARQIFQTLVQFRNASGRRQ